jgi:hypothetical protein
MSNIIIGSCYISDRCLHDINPFVGVEAKSDEETFNTIYNNIKTMMYINNHASSIDGSYIQDKNNVTKELAKKKYETIQKNSMLIDMIFEYGSMLLLIIALLVFIMKAKHENIINYIIILICIILSQSFTIYNKLIN